MYKIDKDFLKKALKASIARSVWGRDKYLEVFYQMDNQMLKALELFPFAVDLANSR
jgi:hypothetical protein